MKKIYITFLLSAFTAFSQISNGQGFYLGIRGGISIPNLIAGSSNKNPLNTGYTSRLGPDAGLSIELKFCDFFSLETGIEYAAEGGQKTGLQAFATPETIAAAYPVGQSPQYLYAYYKSVAKINYLIVPLLAKVSWRLSQSPLHLFVEGGPFAGLLLSAKQETSGQSKLYLDPNAQQALPSNTSSFNNTENIKSQLHACNVGLEGCIGINYKLRRSNIFVEGGGNYGLLNIQKNASNGRNNIGAAIVTLGYSFLISK